MTPARVHLGLFQRVGEHTASDDGVDALAYHACQQAHDAAANRWNHFQSRGVARVLLDVAVEFVAVTVILQDADLHRVQAGQPVEAPFLFGQSPEHIA